MPLPIIAEDEYSRTFQLPDGSTAKLVVEEDLSSVMAFDKAGQKIGSLDFRNNVPFRRRQLNVIPG
jgi:hypothetical protein